MRQSRTNANTSFTKGSRDEKQQELSASQHRRSHSRGNERESQYHHSISKKASKYSIGHGSKQGRQEYSDAQSVRSSSIHGAQDPSLKLSLEKMAG